MALPVEQDMVKLDHLTAWDRMQGEYQTMGLHPAGHIMAYLRDQVGPNVANSQEVAGLQNGAEVTVAGLVIRRQRPQGKAVFITLEDEFGHIPLIIWPAVYQRYRQALREPLVVAQGTVSRREGTMNIVLTHARQVPVQVRAPKAKSWG